MRIIDSARKHGIADADIRHAIRLELRTVGDRERVLVVGPARSGQLLEIVILDHADDPVVIHAMPLRATFFDYLR